MPIETHVKLEGFDALRRDLDRAPEIVQVEMKKAMRASVQHVKKATVSRAPSSNGRRSKGSLRDGPIKRKVGATVRGKGDNLQGKVRVKPFYAKILHRGARPHTIVPKVATVLSFESGRRIYAKRVNHPGTRANPFLDRAFEASKPAIDGYWDGAAANVTKTLAGGRR